MAKKTKYLPLRPLLKHLGACPESLRWLAHNKFSTFQEAVAACPDPSWLACLLTILFDQIPNLYDTESQAYQAGTAAAHKYWDSIELAPHGTRKRNQQWKDGLVIEAAAYREACRDVWVEVERQLIQLGLAENVWPTGRRK